MDHSLKMHDQTELPGQKFPAEVLDIIAHRYHVAGQYVRGKEVLEIGSGSGMGLSYLSKLSLNIVAGEYSKENLAQLIKRQYPNVRFSQLDAHDMPFENQSFDTILAMAMIYYLRLEDFLKEACRVLRPGGILFFCSSNKDVPGFVPSPYTTGYYSVPQMCEQLLANGFTVKVHGAFPILRNEFIWILRAYLKKVAKALILSLPNGEKAWQKIKDQSVDEFLELPSDIPDELLSDPGLLSLDTKRKDRIHRVLYYTATKIA